MRHNVVTLVNVVQLFRISDSGWTFLAVGRDHFQTLTIRHGLIPLLFPAYFQLRPIDSGSDALLEDSTGIDNGERPFRFGLVPVAADLFCFVADGGAHGSWKERAAGSRLEGQGGELLKLVVGTW